MLRAESEQQPRSPQAENEPRTTSESRLFYSCFVQQPSNSMSTAAAFFTSLAIRRPPHSPPLSVVRLLSLTTPSATPAPPSTRLASPRPWLALFPSLPLIQPSRCPLPVRLHFTMPIRFILMVNKQGQTRLAQYYETMTIREKSTLESEMIRKCLARGEDQVSQPANSRSSPDSNRHHQMTAPRHISTSRQQHACECCVAVRC